MRTLHRGVSCSPEVQGEQEAFSWKTVRITPVVPEHRGPVVVQSLSYVQLFPTLWTTECQTSLSVTISWSLLKFMSIKTVMPSNHLILCDSSTSLYTARVGRGETKEVFGAPAGGQKEEGSQGPFSSRALGGPQDTECDLAQP